jgi:hypothetical protein
MNDPRREILQQVAAGTITAEEGAARLAALDTEQATTSPLTVTSPPAASIREVRLNARFGNTEVIGDPSVASAVADGPHRARQEGDVMVIEQSLLGDSGSFEFRRAGRSLLGVDGDKLTIRMNPSAALTARVQAGNLRISGVHGAISGDIQAGNCDLTDFRGPLTLTVSAGSVNAQGRLEGGVNAIRCQMGEVRVALDPSSNVRVRARSTLGDVVLDGPGSTGSELTVGSGAGSLECSCTMGTVRISVD